MRGAGQYKGGWYGENGGSFKGGGFLNKREIHSTELYLGNLDRKGGTLTRHFITYPNLYKFI